MKTEQAVPDMQGRVLIIAGSDSGGGAGVQADLKTVTAMGGFGMSAITAITAQNTLGVHGVWPVAIEAVEAQMRVVLSDIGADAIKTGMLGGWQLIERVAEVLAEMARDVARIIDPVMVATSGDPLIDERGVDALSALLLPGATLITPNAPEAERLTGKGVDGINGQRRAAEALLEKGAKAALVKGGHIPGKTVVDVLQSEYGEWIFESERIETDATHGTGCTLASAIAAGVAQGKPLNIAAETASAYLRGALLHAPGLGAGHGPLGHGWALNRQEEA